MKIGDQDMLMGIKHEASNIMKDNRDYIIKLRACSCLFMLFIKRKFNKPGEHSYLFIIFIRNKFRELNKPSRN